MPPEFSVHAAIAPIEVFDAVEEEPDPERLALRLLTRAVQVSED